MRLSVLAASCAVATVLAAGVRPAAAAEYELFVDVESEEALFDLLESQQISEETFELLVELLRQGVDLDRATREELYSLPNLTYAEVDAILAYRRESGAVGEPTNLVAAGVLSADKLVAIAPFLRVSTGRPVAYATDGWVRVPMLYTPPVADLPAMAAQARVVTLKYLSFGAAAVVTRNRLGEVVYDPSRDALSAGDYGAQVHLPKLFVRYEKGDFAAIAGSYRIGFGQKLTFDNTSRYTPNGFVVDDDLTRGSSLTSSCKESTGELDASPCAGAAANEYTAPDFRWREGLFGAAVSLRGIPAGPGTVQLHGFTSAAARPIYQYEIYDRKDCDDPRNDDDPACAAPRVYKRQDDLLAPTSTFSFSTLPDMFRETTAGANVSWFAGDRTHLGATGYLSSIHWLTEGMDLDFQEYARYPRGGAFGALGVDGAFRLRASDVFLEVARSFDSAPVDQDGGGGFAAILRTTATWDKQELETTLRYYDTAFANPYARPIAEPDEYEGQRARDEAGLRLKYTGSFDRRLSIRATADVWAPPSESYERVKALVFLRGDWLATRRLGLGVWTSWQDKGLGVDEMTPCYEIATDVGLDGEPIDCTGQKLQAAVRVKLMPSKRLTLSAQYSHELLDDGDLRFADSGGRRQDAQAWLMATWRATDALRLRARTRWLDDGLGQPDYLESSLWTYAELAYSWQKAWRARLRYDVYAYIDDRDSTIERSPNPEQWLWLEFEAKF